MSTKTKLIVHTGSHKKAVINLELAESILPKELLNQTQSHPNRTKPHPRGGK
jgi:hypothetical protein